MIMSDFAVPAILRSMLFTMWGNLSAGTPTTISSALYLPNIRQAISMKLTPILPVVIGPAMVPEQKGSPCTVSIVPVSKASRNMMRLTWNGVPVKRITSTMKLAFSKGEKARYCPCLGVRFCTASSILCAAALDAASLFVPGSPPDQELVAHLCRGEPSRCRRYSFPSSRRRFLS